jgi:hypothetical protein
MLMLHNLTSLLRSMTMRKRSPRESLQADPAEPLEDDVPHLRRVSPQVQKAMRIRLQMPSLLVMMPTNPTGPLRSW